MNRPAFVQMQTNEETRVISDRRKQVNIYDIFGEILGNMCGDIRKINIINGTLYTYQSDNGFSEKDKIALFQKNRSGNNENTAGLNGIGIKMAIDRLLYNNDDPTNDDQKHTTIYSLNDKNKCWVGGYTYVDWIDYDSSDEEYIKDLNVMKLMEVDIDKGSFFKIPVFSNEKNNMDLVKLKEYCGRFLNIPISEGSIQFFWNCELVTIDRISPIENSLILNYQLGYTMKKQNGDGKTSRTILKITNYHELENTFIVDNTNVPVNIRDIVPEYCYINKLIPNCFDNPENVTNIERWQSKESGTMRINVVDNDRGEDYGCNLYINKNCITQKSIRKGLGKMSKTFDPKEYSGGRPRFENQVQKHTIQYDLEAVKSNSDVRRCGEHVIKYMHLVAQATYVKARKPHIHSPIPIPPQPSKDKSVRIYALYSNDVPGRIKIGFSEGSEAALKQQYGTRHHPRGVTIFNWKEFTVRDKSLPEKYIFEKLKDDRIEDTEWFSMDVNEENKKQINNIIDDCKF